MSGRSGIQIAFPVIRCRADQGEAWGQYMDNQCKGNSARNQVAAVAAFVFYMYAFGAIITAPYFNWKYAREHGLVRWIVLGELVATSKSFIWPYFLYTARDTGHAGATTPGDTNTPEKKTIGLNSSEVSRLDAIVSETVQTGFNASTERITRELLTGYKTRSGQYLSSEFYSQYLKPVELLVDYKYELGQSALLSWDRGQYAVTPEYTRLRGEVTSIVPGEQLTADTHMIELASSHASTISDSSGAVFTISRDSILQGLAQRENQRVAVKKLLTVVREFVR